MKNGNGKNNHNIQSTSKTPKDSPQQIQINAIKKIVMTTLEKLFDTEDIISINQKVRSSLKRDLNDLKEGRLDRIIERYEIDEESRKNSVFAIKRKATIGDKKSAMHWYQPFIVYIDGEDSDTEIIINNSLTKIHAAGTYKLISGEVKYL